MKLPKLTSWQTLGISKVRTASAPTNQWELTGARMIYKALERFKMGMLCSPFLNKSPTTANCPNLKF